MSKIAVPTLLAVFAVLFAFKTVGLGTAGTPAKPTVEVAPTPYSADHARITVNEDGGGTDPAPSF